MMTYELQCEKEWISTHTTLACCLEFLKVALPTHFDRQQSSLLTEQITEALREQWPLLVDSQFTHLKWLNGVGSLHIRALKNGTAELRLHCKLLVKSEMYLASGADTSIELRASFLRPLLGNLSLSWLLLSTKRGSSSQNKYLSVRYSYKSTTP